MWHPSWEVKNLETIEVVVSRFLWYNYAPQKQWTRQGVKEFYSPCPFYELPNGAKTSNHPISIHERTKQKGYRYKEIWSFRNIHWDCRVTIFKHLVDRRKGTQHDCWKFIIQRRRLPSKTSMYRVSKSLTLTRRTNLLSIRPKPIIASSQLGSLPLETQVKQWLGGKIQLKHRLLYKRGKNQSKYLKESGGSGNVIAGWALINCCFRFQFSTRIGPSCSVWINRNMGLYKKWGRNQRK